jgi:hypothetical protein
MITPTKTYTDNPFVDNVVYYAKLLGINSVVKDEDEALENETPESLYDGDVLIACVEGTSTYELFKSIPKEILEKYIQSVSNLDMYVNNPSTLQVYLNSLSKYDRTKLLNKISALARTIYIDHYDVMMSYIESLDPDWITKKKALYDSCIAGSATYLDLFEELPKETIERIFRWYINNYDDTDLSTLSSSLNEFKKYVEKRTDAGIKEELANVSKAMRGVFSSHYEMMVERGYVREDHQEWLGYVNYTETYQRCMDGTCTYQELYALFPKESLLDSLNTCIGKATVAKYDLTNGLYLLEDYFSNHSNNSLAEQNALTRNMIAKYLSNYGTYVNFDIYNKCIDELLDYFDLVNYIPKETLKIILNTEIDEVTNLDVYEDSKEVLNQYLSSLPLAQRNEIKEAINIDMRAWYPDHHVEKNNYYRSFIGLPPMNSSGYIYEDTLVHTYDENTGTYTEFGTRFTSQVPANTYPEVHWKQPLYLFDAYDLAILKEAGILDDYIAACGSTFSSTRYRYLKFLADEKLDLYTCRRALRFQLIGVPTIDDTYIRKKFVDAYAVNRDYVIRTVYSEAYKFQSDYYNKFIIMFIIINAMTDMLVDIPDMIINREVFDSRCIKYLFESFGIPFYSEIPVKYLKAMLKNLNILIKYKSSTKNMIDICSLFGFSDVRVFGYYLFRQRNIDSNTGEYTLDEDNSISYDLDKLYVRDTNGTILDYSGIRYTKLTEYRNYSEEKYTKVIHVTDDKGVVTEKRIINNEMDVYLRDEKYDEFIPLKDADYFKSIKADTEPATLKFIKVPIDESLTDYKNDPDYIINYDEIVYQDEGDTWDGGLDHEQLRQDLLDYEFNAVKTKYVSVETVTEMTEMAFQVSYFYNMLFDNLYSEEALTVEIPYIKLGHQFKFMDVVCYLFALMYFYNGLEDNIMYSPTQILYVKGYNFDTDLNTVLQDATAFQQTDPTYGTALQDYEKYNIFDINDRISEDNYDYREAFDSYRIKSFNLEVDIDALEVWLNTEYQMSLDDFVVDDSLTTFDQVITLKSFFSLNNSYYQKSIFKNALLPLPYNQDIKYAFDYDLYKKSQTRDIDGNVHYYIQEKSGNQYYYIEVINNTDDEVYICDNDKYIDFDTETHALYILYKRNDNGAYICSDYNYYKCINGVYSPILSGEIGIINKDGLYIFATDKYYTKEDDGTYQEITDERFFSVDPYDSSKKILNFGTYYIKQNGQWILDPTNAYIKVTKNGTTYYVLLSSAGDYSNATVSEEDCYVLHSDGHFVKLTETDYYIRTHNGTGESEEFVFNEEDCYVITDSVTEYYDASVSPRVYYEKLSDYYSENNWVVYKDECYVKDSAGNYIPESNLLNPNNCYYIATGDKYDLVVNALGEYKSYKLKSDLEYILILQESNDYSRFKLSGNNYVLASDTSKRYILDSDSDYVIVLYQNALYDNTELMIVVFNKEITYESSKVIQTDEYNPSNTDGVWDENDWFYQEPGSDPDNSIGMNGENKWYYRKPGSGESVTTEEKETALVGSGYYIESTAYIGNVKLVKGEKYYMAFDFETNFTGRIQIYNDADSECTDLSSRVYEVSAGVRQHLSQVFIANENETPSIKFLIYDFEDYPIKCGDYIAISDIRFVKAHADNFVAQDIPSYDKLQQLYKTNEAIYKYLVSLMANCSDYKTYEIYKKLYDALMTSKYNKEAFKTGDKEYAKTYTDFLKNRDVVLYEQLVYFKSLDEDAMHKQVADQIIEVTYAIDDCVDTYSYGYLYSYFPAVSANYIQQYISKIINFFKSWKVHLLGINTVYKFDDPLENTIKILEQQDFRIRRNGVVGDVHIHDSVKINPLDSTDVSGTSYTDIFPDMEDLVTNEYADTVGIRDSVRIIAREANKVVITDDFENMHVVLNDDSIDVKNDDGNIVISSGDAGFSTENTNELIMTTDETDEQAFVSQRIHEINLDSLDINGEE